MRHLRESWMVAPLALISMAARGLACTVVYPTVVVGPNFRVKVEDRGRPVKGLRVGLSSSSGVSKDRAVTGKNGVALFRNVRPGSYDLTADHDAGFADGAEVEVGLTESSEVTIPLRWPDATPLLARSLKGFLRLPDRIQGKPQPSLSLELLEGVSGRKLKSANTDEKGAFDFPDVARGLYFLRLRQPESKIIEGLISLDVEPGIAAHDLEIELGWTSCGLSYVDQSRCPQSSLHLERLAGRVVDATEAAIPEAEISLFALRGEVVQQTWSDSVGHFAFRPADGEYQLVVQRAGFTTLRTTLTIDYSAVPSLLEVQLGVIGVCSDARTH